MTTEEKKFRKARAAELKNKVRIQRDTLGEIKRQLQAASDSVITILASQPTDFQRWYLPQLQKAIKAKMDVLADRSATTISTGADKAWAAGLALVDKPLAAAGVSITGTLPLINTRLLLAMKTFMTDRIRDISAAAVNKINTELSLVIIGAQSPNDAINHVQKLLGVQSRQRAITIVRTELGRVYAHASYQRLLQSAQRVPGLQKQWRRSGKIHSRPEHDAADGQVRDVDQPFVIAGVKLMYPRDPAAPASHTINCGCDILPYKKDWKNVRHPGRKPFTPDELARNPFKRNLQQALDSRLSVPDTQVAYGAPKVGKVISEFQQRIATSKVEEAVVLSKTGEVLLTKTGTEHSVPFTDAEQKLMKDAITIHNHPTITSFSVRDVQTSARLQVAEMRVIDPAYLYIMRPPPSGWSERSFEQKILPAVEEVEAKLIGQMYDALLSGKITEDQFDVHYQHILWTRVSRRAGLKYSRRKRTR